MAKENKQKVQILFQGQEPDQEPESDNNEELGADFCPFVDKQALIVMMKMLIDESNDIAGYIDQNVHYGRALGYGQ